MPVELYKTEDVHISNTEAHSCDRFCNGRTA